MHHTYHVTSLHQTHSAHSSCSFAYGFPSFKFKRNSNWPVLTTPAMRKRENNIQARTNNGQPLLSVTLKQHKVLATLTQIIITGVSDKWKNLFCFLFKSSKCLHALGNEVRGLSLIKAFKVWSRILLSCVWLVPLTVKLDLLLQHLALWPPSGARGLQHRATCSTRSILHVITFLFWYINK